MPDRIETTRQTQALIHDPSLCPSWCTQEHLKLDAMNEGFHHGGEQATILPAFEMIVGQPDVLRVSCSQFVDCRGTSLKPSVELLNARDEATRLSPAEARDLAALLIDRADVLTAEALRPCPTAELDRSTRPFWQTEPCPPWCSTGHEASEQQEDRKHWSATERLPLTLHGLQRKPDNSGWYDDPPILDVYLVQQVREAEPRVSLSVNEAPPTDLTLSEARHLQGALQALLQDATGAA